MLGQYELQHGITSICPATMTLPEDQLITICQTAVRYAQLSSSFNRNAPFQDQTTCALRCMQHSGNSGACRYSSGRTFYFTCQKGGSERSIYPYSFCLSVSEIMGCLGWSSETHHHSSRTGRRSPLYPGVFRQGTYLCRSYDR